MGFTLFCSFIIIACSLFWLSEYRKMDDKKKNRPSVITGLIINILLQSYGWGIFIWVMVHLFKHYF